MFKKNTAVTGFPIGKFIKTADGSEVATGTPDCKRAINGAGSAAEMRRPTTRRPDCGRSISRRPI